MCPAGGGCSSNSSAKARTSPSPSALIALFFAIPAFQDTAGADWLKKEDLAVTFLDSYGQIVGRRGIKHDDSVPIEQMPKYLIDAVIATEDRRFFEHFGIDFVGVFRALMVDARRRTASSRAARRSPSNSPRTSFLSNERTLTRKIKEAYLALWLEGHLTKREILQLYLDRIYMGGGTFGVQAASQFYFGKSVRDVTLAEAAMLAGLFKAPTKYAPHVNLPAARARANEVLNNLVDAGYLTEGQIYAAVRNPATPVAAQPDLFARIGISTGPIMRCASSPDAGKLGNDRVLTVRTALDSNLQQYADDDDRRPAARIRPGLSRQTIGHGHSRPFERRGAHHRRRPGLWRRASSIAPPTPCASRAPRSSRSSI